MASLRDIIGDEKIRDIIARSDNYPVHQPPVK